MEITGKIFKIGENLKKIGAGYVGYIDNKEVFATEDLGKNLPILTINSLSMNDLTAIRVSVIIEGKCHCPCHTDSGFRHFAACCNPTYRLNTGITSDGKEIVQYKQL